MKFYQHKDFLTFDDVAEYLMDKGMFDFDISNSSDRYKLNCFLKDLVLDEKLSIVFRYYGKANLFNKEFINDNRPILEKINIFTNEQTLILLFDRGMLKNWLDGEEFLRHKFFDKEMHTDYFCIPVYKIFGYEYTITDNKEHPFIILLDDSSGQYGVDPLFPKSQLDNLFLQHQKDNLQQQINAIDSQLNDKELSTRSQNTVGTIIAGLANLANIDLKSHYGDDSNKKIRQELLKLGFKANEKDGLPLSSETVAKWLKIADDLSK